MEWSAEAEAAIDKVPFFVRKKVRKRVEEQTAATGKNMVGLVDVKATQKRYLSGMASEVRGYQLDVCFGPNGCPNRAVKADGLVEKLERSLKNARLKDFLTEQVGKNIKFHHEFRVTIAECPNACSQPQIKDIGIIGARMPAITQEACTGCGACGKICPDASVTLEDKKGPPVIDWGKCLACGQCIDACPTGTLATGARGYKVLLAGKLGRHPRLAQEIPGIFSEDDVVEMVATCIDFYKQNSRHGKRFGQILTRDAFQTLADRFTAGVTPDKKETVK